MPTKTNRKDAREELRKDHPGVWIPVNDGDVIEGTVTDVTLAWSDVQAQGRGDGNYPLLRVAVQDATGYPDSVTELTVHGMPTILQNEIIVQEPKPGETVQITYLGTGEAKTRGRNAPELFRLRMPDRDPAEVAAGVYGALKSKLTNRGQAATPAADGVDDEQIGF
jgi:hypothetical protein